MMICPHISLAHSLCLDGMKRMSDPNVSKMCRITLRGAGEREREKEKERERGEWEWEGVGEEGTEREREREGGRERVEGRERRIS